MYVANPNMTIRPDVLTCGETAVVDLTFRAASALYDHPAEIVLMMDHSAGMSQSELDHAKAAANQFIRDIAAASTGAGDTVITNQSRMAFMGFADTADQVVSLTHDPDVLYAAVNALQVSSAAADYKKAFTKADVLLPKAGKIRSILVLFTHSTEEVSAEADAVVRQMKSSGVEVYCIGLLSDPAKLNAWASAPAKDHVACTDAASQLKKVFTEIAAEVVLAGVLDGVITEKLAPGFTVTKLHTPSDGTAKLDGQEGLVWTIPQAALKQQPKVISLSFDVLCTGSGVKALNESITYADRAGNSLLFPNPTVDIRCGGPQLFPEPCPTPVDFAVESCQDAARVDLGQVTMHGLGRIVQVDATVKNVCPGKQVAVSILLVETDPDGAEYPRGAKHMLLPAQAGDSCRDVTLRCIPFSLPEALDPIGSPDSLCSPRSFSARVIANYVDTDFVCCEAPIQTV